MTKPSIEYYRKWRANNKDQINERTSRWRNENREHYTKYQREYARKRRAKAKLEKLNNVN